MSVTYLFGNVDERGRAELDELGADVRDSIVQGSDYLSSVLGSSIVTDKRLSKGLTAAELEAATVKPQADAEDFSNIDELAVDSGRRVKPPGDAGSDSEGPSEHDDADAAPTITLQAAQKRYGPDDLERLFPGFTSNKLRFTEVFLPKTKRRQLTLNHAISVSQHRAWVGAGQYELAPSDTVAFHTQPAPPSFPLPGAAPLEDEGPTGPGLPNAASPTKPTVTHGREAHAHAVEALIADTTDPAHASMNAVLLDDWEARIAWEDEVPPVTLHVADPHVDRAIAIPDDSDNGGDTTAGGFHPAVAAATPSGTDPVAAAASIKPAAAATTMTTTAPVAADSALVSDATLAMLNSVNLHVESDDWMDQIIWDDAVPVTHAPTWLALPQGVSVLAPAAPSSPSALPSLSYSVLPSAMDVKRLTDKLNISKDRFYEVKERKTARVRQAHAAITLHHPEPTARLYAPWFRTSMSVEELRAFHRPPIALPLDAPIVFQRVRSSGKKKKKQQEKLKQLQKHGAGAGAALLAAKVPGLAVASDISLRDTSKFQLFEYSEEYPSLMSNTGMATLLYNYYRKRDEKDTTTPEDPIGLPFALEPGDASPFGLFGRVREGEVVKALSNNLFRAPVWRHETRSLDFLLIRTASRGAHKYYVRPLDGAFVVGQTLPSLEVPVPQSRMISKYLKTAMQVVAHRLMRRHPQRLFSMAAFKRYFPGRSDVDIRTKIKDFAQFAKRGETSGWYRLQPNIPLLTEEECRKLVTPEMFVLMNTSQAGQQRLIDCGFDKDELNSAEKADLGAGLDASVGELELQLAPWITTRNFVMAQQGKAMLKLFGAGDPTGCGEGISFIRTSMKEMFHRAGDAPAGSNADDAHASGSSRFVISDQQQVYREEIERIWDAQADSLSRKEPPTAPTAHSSAPTAAITATTTATPGAPLPAIPETASLVDGGASASASAAAGSAAGSTPAPASGAPSVVPPSHIDPAFQDGTFSPTSGSVRPGSTIFPDDDATTEADAGLFDSTTGQSKALVIHRLKWIDGEQRWVTDLVRRPQVIQAYLRHRKNIAKKEDAALLQARRELLGTAGGGGGGEGSASATPVPDPDAELPELDVDRIRAIKHRVLRAYVKSLNIEIDESQMKNKPPKAALPKLTLSFSKTKMEEAAGSADPAPAAAPAASTAPSAASPAAPPPQDASADPAAAAPPRQRRGSRDPVEQTHAESLRRLAARKRRGTAPEVELSLYLEKIVQYLTQRPDSLDFCHPVHPSRAPDYHRIVTRPIALEEMRDKAKAMQYPSAAAFLADLEQMAANSALYNGPGSPFTRVAQSIVAQGRAELTAIQDVVSQLEQQIRERQSSVLARMAPEALGAGLAGPPRASLKSEPSSQEVMAKAQQLTDNIRAVMEDSDGSDLDDGDGDGGDHAMSDDVPPPAEFVSVAATPAPTDGGADDDDDENDEDNAAANGDDHDGVPDDDEPTAPPPPRDDDEEMEIE